MANYPSKFTYDPEWPALEEHLREVLNHDHDAPGSTPGADPLDALVAFLTQRDRQLEDYLGTQTQAAGGTPEAYAHLGLLGGPLPLAQVGHPPATTIPWQVTDHLGMTVTVGNDDGPNASVNVPRPGLYIISWGIGLGAGFTSTQISATDDIGFQNPGVAGPTFLTDLRVSTGLVGGNGGVASPFHWRWMEASPDPTDFSLTVVGNGAADTITSAFLDILKLA